MKSRNTVALRIQASRKVGHMPDIEDHPFGRAVVEQSQRIRRLIIGGLSAVAFLGIGGVAIEGLSNRLDERRCAPLSQPLTGQQAYNLAESGNSDLSDPTGAFIIKNNLSQNVFDQPNAIPEGTRLKVDTCPS